MRFPEFNGEWKQVTLGDITTNFSRRNKDGKEFPMYSVTNTKGFIPQNELFEDREMMGEDIKSYKIIEQGEFAYNPARINVGSIARYTDSEPCMISSLYVCFKSNEEIDGGFLMHFLKSPKANFYYNANGEGGVRVYLFYPNFARIKFAMPSLLEQHKISELLSLIDERIAVQRKIIDKLETLMVGTVDKVTTKSANLSLGDCLECYTSTLQEGETSEQGIYPVYGANGVCGYLDYSTISTPAILIVKDGSGVGNVSYTNGGCSVVATLNYLVPKKNFSAKYLYFILKRFNFLPYKTGMAIPHIYFKAYSKALIFCPSFEEQTRIATSLSNIEEKIRIEERFLSLLQVQKKYMLSTMFI